MVNSTGAWVAGYGKLCGLDGLHLVRGERVCLWDRLPRAGRKAALQKHHMFEKWKEVAVDGN